MLAVPIAVLVLTLVAIYREAGGSLAAEQTIEQMYEERSGAALTQSQHQTLTEAQERRDAARRRLFWILIVSGTGGPLSAVCFYLVLADRMTRRLRAVRENARRLARGMPLAPLPDGTDEIAALARELKEAAYLMQGRERELRESESRYRDLFDRAPIPYEETDAAGRVRRFNQELCTLLHSTPGHAPERYAWDLVAPDQKESFRAAMLERIGAGRETGPLECDYLLEDGSRITVEICESLIRGEGGDVTGVCRSLLDVTERNLSALAARKVAQYAMELSNRNEQLARALEAARSATEAKSRFLAVVSHELRTPLNGIIGFSEMMFDGKLGEVTEDQRDIMGDILTSARHLLQLINDILDLSKVEAGKMEFRPEPCEVGVLIQEVSEAIRPLAEKKAIVISTEVPAGIDGHIDRTRFKQVLYNYISNAVKFTGPGGRVAVRARLEPGDLLSLEVEDTGAGILPEDMPMLFCEFQQLPNSRKQGQGTGLGLALTRRIIEAQGGRVAAHSTPGRGSIFSASLPLHA